MIFWWAKIVGIHSVEQNMSCVEDAKGQQSCVASTFKAKMRRQVAAGRGEGGEQNVFIFVGSAASGVNAMVELAPLNLICHH